MAELVCDDRRSAARVAMVGAGDIVQWRLDRRNGLPIMTMRASWHSRAIVGLLLLESAIFVLSGEVSFGFTTMACLLAFCPQRARRVYPGAFVVLAACAVMLEWGRG